MEQYKTGVNNMIDSQKYQKGFILDFPSSDKAKRIQDVKINYNHKNGKSHLHATIDGVKRCGILIKDIEIHNFYIRLKRDVKAARETWLNNNDYDLKYLKCANDFFWEGADGLIRNSGYTLSKTKDGSYYYSEILHSENGLKKEFKMELANPKGLDDYLKAEKALKDALISIAADKRFFGNLLDKPAVKKNGVSR